MSNIKRTKKKMSHIPRPDGIDPVKSLGQNFLIDTAIAARIVDKIPTKYCGPIVEIGPGKGVLTEFLIRRRNPLKLVEIDERLSQYIGNKFHNYKNDHFQIFNDDILKVPEILFEDKPFVISNLPYNISTEIISIFLDSAQNVSGSSTPGFSGCILMMQKEVIDRLVSPPDSRTYGRISVGFQLKMEYERLFDVEPNSFDPTPKVRSSVIYFKVRNDLERIQNPDVLKGLVNMCFSSRRKKIKNNINPSFFKNRFEKKDIELLFENGSIMDLRAENLSPEDYLRLSNTLVETT